VRGLTIVVAGTDEERFHAALSLAAASAALGLRSRLFLQGEAARLMRDLRSAADDHRRSVGVPTLGDLLDEALALGVQLIVCQSGLALAGMHAEDLPPHVTTGGLVELLATRSDDQLVMA
jgi:predicted peroxiredoxin